MKAFEQGTVKKSQSNTQIKLSGDKPGSCCTSLMDEILRHVLKDVLTFFGPDSCSVDFTIA